MQSRKSGELNYPRQPAYSGVSRVAPLQAQRGVKRVHEDTHVKKMVPVKLNNWFLNPNLPKPKYTWPISEKDMQIERKTIFALSELDIKTYTQRAAALQKLLESFPVKKEIIYQTTYLVEKNNLFPIQPQQGSETTAKVTFNEVEEIYDKDDSELRDGLILSLGTDPKVEYWKKLIAEHRKITQETDKKPQFLKPGIKKQKIQLPVISTVEATPKTEFDAQEYEKNFLKGLQERVQTCQVVDAEAKGEFDDMADEELFYFNKASEYKHVKATIEKFKKRYFDSDGRFRGDRKKEKSEGQGSLKAMEEDEKLPPTYLGATTTTIPTVPKR